jgi:CheY-like chemotaxis protein
MAWDDLSFPARSGERQGYAVRNVELVRLRRTAAHSYGKNQNKHAISEDPLYSEIERKKILIVDDELDMRIFLCNLLGNCGYDPIDAGDKDQGMQKAVSEKPALIILDVTMPKETGIQMYRELKEHEDLKKVPVIMVSTIDKRTFSFYQKLQGTPRHKSVPDPGAYLEKPLEAEELIELVRTLTKIDECPLAEDDD